MAIISVNNVKFSYVDTPILRDASLQVEPNDKIGLIGPNGCGKSTLLKLIIGAIEPDDGTILIRKLSDIGYLEQVVAAENETAFAFCESVFQDVYALEHRMRALETKMATDQSPEVMQEYGELLESFADLDGYSIKGRVTAVLSGLGMNPSQLMSQMSGGERSKVAMARLLLRQPDVLILDEPTNHLDLQSVSWLEEFLTEYRGAILVVSHDRYFLDKICNKIVKMDFGHTQTFKGNYSEAMRQYREQVIAQNKAYELQQKEIRRQEDMIRSYYNRATELQIKRAKSKQKLLDKVERIEKHSEPSTQFKLNLKSSGRGGNEVLILNEISKRYTEDGREKTVLDHASLSVFKDDKIGLIGVNGSGKTTLFRIALGELEPDSGTVKFGAEIKTGYFSQNMESLDFNKTIMEEVHDAYPSMTLSEVRGKLGAFMFKDDLDRKVGAISGGERSRIQLLKLMLSPANLLLLDEPTNHLDIDSKELLDDALERYEGSFITISHDRFFLNAVCNKIAKLENGKIRMFEGNYDDYMEVVKREEERERAKQEAATTPPPKPTKNAKKAPAAKKRSKKAVEAEIQALEERIHELELSQFEEQVYNDYQKMREVTEEIEDLKQKCEECYNELFE